MNTTPTIPAAESLTLCGDETQVYDVHRGAGFSGVSPAGRVVARWHDETHAGAFSMCQEQPCHAVKRVDGA